jgi:CheY-like chemotaxis protein
MTNAKLRILAVDDDPLTLLTLKKVLGDRYELFTSSSPMNALATVAECSFDLIITDLEMPGMDGVSFMSEVKKNPANSTIPFLFLSGISELDQSLSAFQAGANDFIVKPVIPGLLKAKVSAYLNYSVSLKQQQHLWAGKYLNASKRKIALVTNDVVSESYPDMISIVDSSSFLENPSLIDEYAFVAVDLSDEAVSNWILQRKNNYASSISCVVFYPTSPFDNLDLPQFKKPDNIQTWFNLIFDLAEFEKFSVNKQHNAVKQAISDLPLTKSDKIQFDDGLLVSGLRINYDGFPGGDFTDVIDVGSGKVYVIGDVMGKQWTAWFYSLAFVAYVRPLIRLFLSSSDAESDLEGVFKKINLSIIADTKLADAFTTLCLIYHKQNTNTLSICSSGFRPIIYRRCDGSINKIITSASLLGLSPNATFNKVELSLEMGDVLFISTDGFHELKGKDGKMVKEEGIIKFLAKVLPSAKSLAAEDVVQMFLSYNSTLGFDDDASLLLFQNPS